MLVLVLVLDLVSMNRSDLSSLEEQPAMVVSRTKMTKHNEAEIVFGLIAGILFNDSPGEILLVQHLLPFKYCATWRLFSILYA